MTDVPFYKWGEWPEHLLTKKQMSDAGYNTGAKLPPPAGACHRKDSPGGVMWLYDRAQGVPKRQPSEAQKAALAKAQDMARMVDVVCVRCGEYIATVTNKRALEWTRELCHMCVAHDKAVTDAKAWLENADLILDTETTGLGDKDQIIQIGIINLSGNVLLDTLIKPTIPIPPAATAIHGITDETVASAPTFADVYPRLIEIVTGKTIIVYNADFDAAMLYNDCGRHNLPRIVLKTRCAMNLYARYFGEWSDYWKSYQWQSLPYGDHSAVGDCLGTLRLLQEMANGE
jgi:DNA polymerase III subunit epsilon